MFTFGWRAVVLEQVGNVRKPEVATVQSARICSILVSISFASMSQLLTKLHISFDDAPSPVSIGEKGN